MPMFHAVLSIDHHHAQLLQFDGRHVKSQRLRAHGQHLRKHGHNEHGEHEFFGEVRDALQGITEVLVVGTRTGLAGFRHYVEKHRASCARQIAGYESVNQPTEGELLALARRYFQKYDLMAGTPSAL